MRKKLTLILGVLVAIPALVVGQIQQAPATQAKIESQAAIDSANYHNIPAERRFAIVEFVDSVHYNVIKLITNVVMVTEGLVTKAQTPPDTATLYLAADGVTKYVGTTVWRTNAVYDTTFVEKERVDDPSGTPARWVFNNALLAKPTTKPGCYLNSFTGVSVTTSASFREFTFVGDRIEFYGERWQGHGNVKIFIDGVQMATLYQGANPWTTDFTRLAPSFSYNFPKKPEYNSPATSHKIRFETDPGNQFIIDMMRVQTYTLRPRVVTPK
jgi:hypothetical protein